MQAGARLRGGSVHSAGCREWGLHGARADGVRGDTRTGCRSGGQPTPSGPHMGGRSRGVSTGLPEAHGPNQGRDERGPGGAHPRQRCGTHQTQAKGGQDRALQGW